MKLLASRFCWLNAIPLWGTPWPRESTAKRMKKTFFFLVYMKQWLLHKTIRIKKRDMFPMVQVFPVIDWEGRWKEESHLANRLKFQVCSILYCGTGNCCTLEILTFWLGRIVPLKLMAFVDTQVQQSFYLSRIKIRKCGFKFSRKYEIFLELNKYLLNCKVAPKLNYHPVLGETHLDSYFSRR